MFFMQIKMLSFLFLFACMRFVLFVCVKSSCKKNNNKEVQNCPDTLIYYTTDVYPPQPTYGKLFVRTYFYLWSPVGVFSFYWNLFFLWKSLLIYEHLWRSFLFVRISPYLWSSVRIFSFYENLSLFMIICENLFFLWESFQFFLVYDHL